MKTVEKRRMCPNCRAFITSDDRVCPYCDTQVGPRAVDVRAADTFGLLPRANLTSVVFLVINVALFLMTLVIQTRLMNGQMSMDFNAQLLVLLGGKYAPLIQKNGEWWRLITAGFLHGGLLHVAINSYTMFDLVAEVEQFYGTSRVVIVYVFTTITGFLASTLFSPGSISVGASAACFGLIGVMLAVGLRDRTNPLTQAVRAYYRRWAIYGLVFSFMPGLRIDIAAHAGGLAGGFVLGLLVGLPGRPDSPKEQVWKVCAGACVALVVYAFFKDLRFFQAAMQQG